MISLQRKRSVVDNRIRYKRSVHESFETLYDGTIPSLHTYRPDRPDPRSFQVARLDGLGKVPLETTEFRQSGVNVFTRHMGRSFKCCRIGHGLLPLTGGLV